MTFRIVTQSLILCFSLLLSACEGSDSIELNAVNDDAQVNTQENNEQNDGSADNNIGDNETGNSDTEVSKLPGEDPAQENDLEDLTQETDSENPAQENELEDPTKETDSENPAQENDLEDPTQETVTEDLPYHYEYNEAAHEIDVSRWQDSQDNIRSNGDLLIGTNIRLSIFDRDSNIELEALTFSIAEDSAGHYTWPKQLSDAINTNMKLVRAGEMSSAGSISTLKSQYRNRLWLPEGSNLIARLKIQSVENDHVQTVSDRITLQIHNSFSASDQTLHDWLLSITPLGAFSDIPYPNSSQKISDYTPVYQHLDRLLQLAIYSQQLDESCSMNGNDCLHADHYQQAVIAGLNFYATQNYVTDNWWLMHIGFPKRAVKVLLVLAGHITEKNNADTIIAYLKKSSNTVNSPNAKGANLADYAYAQMLWSLSGLLISESPEQQVLFAQDFQYSLEGFSSLSLAASRELSCEGIQLDYSFSQHCVTINGVKYSQLYSGSYGIVQMSNMFNAFSFVTSTAFAFDSETTKSLENVLIDGYGWMSYGGRLDPNIMGRALSRNTAKSSGLLPHINALLTDTAYRYDELIELQTRIRDKNEADNQHYLGNRYFWTSDYMTHLGEGYFSSVRMSSTRTVGTESGNGEGLKNYYMGHGSHFLLKNGDEYDDIQPVWDWRRIPGTTVDQGEQEWSLVEWGKGAQGAHDFVGGVSTEQTGLSTMQYSRANIEDARKSWFHSKHAIVALGSNIRFPNAKGQVLTSIEQSNWSGEPVSVGLQDGTRLELDGSHTRSYTGSNIVWVEHNHTRYVFPISLHQKIQVQVQEQEGSWSEINLGKSTERLSKMVFSLWLEHDKTVAADQYQYTIYPNISKITSHTVLENSQNIQAVHFPQEKQTAMVFHGPQHNWFSTPFVTLKLSSAAAIMVTESEGQEIKLTYSDPSQKLSQITIELQGQYQGTYQAEYNAQTHTTRIVAPLPQAGDLGKTAELLLQLL